MSNIANLFTLIVEFVIITEECSFITKFLGEVFLEQIRCDKMDKLMDEIDKLRSKMIAIAMDYGLDSDETIRCSQELDQLLNQYERMKIVDQQNRPFFPYKFMSNLNVYFPSYCAAQLKKW